MYDEEGSIQYWYNMKYNNRMSILTHTQQSSVMSSTAESEIKAVNHPLKAGFISKYSELYWMDSIFYSYLLRLFGLRVCIGGQTHDRNSKHYEVAQLWLKMKVADGTCIIEKVL